MAPQGQPARGPTRKAGPTQGSSLPRGRRRPAAAGQRVPAAPGPVAPGSHRAASVTEFESLPKGIDISSQQANWSFLVEHGQVRGGSIEFAIVEATAGGGFKQRAFAENWAGVSQTTLIRGAYHFLRTLHVTTPDPNDPTKKIRTREPDRDKVIANAAAQAKLYIDTVGSLEGALPPILDIEAQILERNKDGTPKLILNPREHSANTL